MAPHSRPRASDISLSRVSGSLGCCTKAFSTANSPVVSATAGGVSVTNRIRELVAGCPGPHLPLVLTAYIVPRLRREFTLWSPDPTVDGGRLLRWMARGRVTTTAPGSVLRYLTGVVCAGVSSLADFRSAPESEDDDDGWYPPACLALQPLFSGVTPVPPRHGPDDAVRRGPSHLAAAHSPAANPWRRVTIDVHRRSEAGTSFCKHCVHGGLPHTVRDGVPAYTDVAAKRDLRQLVLQHVRDHGGPCPLVFVLDHCPGDRDAVA